MATLQQEHHLRRRQRRMPKARLNLSIRRRQSQVVYGSESWV